MSVFVEPLERASRRIRVIFLWLAPSIDSHPFGSWLYLYYTNGLGNKKLKYAAAFYTVRFSFIFFKENYALLVLF